jgi:sugar transferase (PEP-CTERM system associated)
MRTIILYFVDAFLILLSGFLTLVLKHGGGGIPDGISFIKEVIFVTVLSQLVLFVNDLYNPEVKESSFNTSIKILIGFTITSFVLTIFYLCFPELHLGKGLFLYMMLTSLVLVILWRMLFSWILSRWKLTRRMLVIGSGSMARIIVHEIQRRTNPGCEIVGLIDDNSEHVGRSIMGLKVIGTHHEVLKIVAQEKISRMVVALNQRRGMFPVNTLLECKLRGVEIIDTPNFYEQLTGKILIKDLRPSWLIFSSGFKHTSLTRIIKRIEDVLLGGIGLILAIPIALVTAILVKLDSPGPVFYKQERLGRYGRPYTILKFRSMSSDAEKRTGPIFASKDDARITRLGRVIRKLRVDEIPQILNVLMGDMSFVGPRPERQFFINQLQRRIPYYTQRLIVKPGITGWSAINYQYSDSIESAVEKLQYDLYYIKNMSIFLDMVILLKTIQVIAIGKGAR